MTSPIPGVKVLLQGAPGTGKTFTARSAADAGLDPFVVFTDPGMETIADDPRIKWCYIPPAHNDWASAIDLAKKINTLTPGKIQDMPGINREKNQQFIKILECCNNFVDHEGKEYGDISTWSTKRILFMDGLTGLSKQSRALTVGQKPTPTQPEWGIMMSNLEGFIDSLVLGLRCHFVLVSHIEMERDEITGSTQIMASTLGRKLAPILPVNFGDVILATRDIDKFYWSPVESRANLKARNLPLKDKQTPSFGPLIENWKKKGGIIES